MRKKATMPQTVEDVKKALIHLQDELKTLTASGYKGINFFRASNMSGQEVKHSAFIAWLFLPEAEHGFGDKMLRMFMKATWNTPQEEEYLDGIKVLSNQEILKAADSTGQTVDEESFMALLQGKIEVYTEHVIVNKESRIDILIKIPNTKTVIVIENKIHSDTHTDQLERYRKEIDHKNSEYRNYSRKFFVFLAPQGQKPINHGGDEKYNSNYCVLSYEDIIKMINELKADLKNGNTTLKKADCTKLKILLEDYIEMVTIEVLAKNAEVREQCKKILKDETCKRALELLGKYTDNVQDVLHYSIDWMKQNAPDIEVEELGKYNPYSINFTTLEMRNFYNRFGEKISTQKAYRFATEGGNKLMFFVIMERTKGKDWTDAQKKVVVDPKELQQNSATKGYDYLTWEQRMNPIDDEFKTQVLDPALNKFLDVIRQNDKRLSLIK